MSHRIKVFNNFVSEEDCKRAIEILDSLDNENKLLVFKDNPNVLVAPEIPEVIEIIKKYSIMANEIHRKENGFLPKLYTTEGFLSLWKPGSTSGIHIDSHHGYEFLQFASVIYFNEDFDGGRIYFPNQNFSYKPKSGDAVLFPCGGMEYPHGVTTVTKGKRYTIAMWHTSSGRNASPDLNVMQ